MRLRKYLKEQDKPFGRYLFGSFREKPEEDTKREWNIFQELVDYVTTKYGPNLDPNFIDIARELKKYEDIYPFVLNPDEKILWRVLFTLSEKQPRKYLSKKFGIKGNLIDKINFNKSIDISGYTFYELGQVWYTANSTIQSGTTDPQGTLDVELDAGVEDDETGAFILKWRANQDEILFNPEFMNELSSEFVETYENEVLRLDNSPIEATLYVRIPKIFQGS